MTKRYEISNGTKAEIRFNEYTGEYVMDHINGWGVYGLGRFGSVEDAEAQLRRLADMWGGYTYNEMADEWERVSRTDRVEDTHVESRDFEGFAL